MILSDCFILLLFNIHYIGSYHFSFHKNIKNNAINNSYIQVQCGKLIPGKEPDSIRVKYDGHDFSLKTSDKEVNNAIKHDVFMMQVDGQLFINQRPLRDEDGVILPVNNYLRALPYKGDKVLVVSYHATMGDVLDLVNIGLDVGLLATGHTTWGSIFLATDLLLTNNNLIYHNLNIITTFFWMPFHKVAA